jgi:two-component system chemotaxis response regulator CheB
MATGPLQVLAIGASTGGIHALGGFFGHLPRQIGLPILVTQHLPRAFMSVFARQLGTASGRKAFVAEDGMELVADQILIAPGDAHLTVERWGRTGVVRLSRSPAASGCLPSVDPMLASLAPLYGSGAVAVILSGMGRDGAIGAARLVECGGSVLVQDEDSCAVWGMPRAALEAGLACAIMPPDKLAHRIGSRALNPPCT